jgi:hypothetical protein
MKYFTMPEGSVIIMSFLNILGYSKKDLEINYHL